MNLARILIVAGAIVAALALSLIAYGAWTWVMARSYKARHIEPEPEPDELPPLPCEGSCHRCGEPCDRIVSHALHLCADHRLGPDGRPKRRNWPPPTVRTQDELDTQTMTLSRELARWDYSGVIEPKPLAMAAFGLQLMFPVEQYDLPVPALAPVPREWKLGPRASPFRISPLMTPAYVDEGEFIRASVAEFYESREWPVTEFLNNRAWFDTEGIAA